MVSGSASYWGSAYLIPDSGVEIEVAWELDLEAGSPYRVEFTEKDTSADRDRIIQGIGGQNPDGSAWRLPVEQAIANVLAGVRYYIEDPHERAYLEVAAAGSVGTSRQ